MEFLESTKAWATSVLILGPRSAASSRVEAIFSGDESVATATCDSFPFDGFVDTQQVHRLAKIFPTGCFDVIVDTTTQSRTQQLLFAGVFPLVRPGGAYVVPPSAEPVEDVLEDGSNDTHRLLQTLHAEGRWDSMYATGEEKRFLAAAVHCSDIDAPNGVATRRFLGGAMEPSSLTNGAADSFVVTTTFVPANANKRHVQRHAKNVAAWIKQKSARMITYRAEDLGDAPLPNDAWRPEVLLSSLEAARDNSVVAFFEHGSEWHASPKQLLEAMGDSDILAAQLEGHPERAWTRRDTFFLTGTESDLSVQQSNQIAATCLLVRANATTRAFVRYWSAMCRLPGAIGNGGGNVCGMRNFDGYIDHRNAQSMLSVLLKTTDAVKSKLVPFSWLHFAFERMDVTPDVRAGVPRIDDHGFWHGEGADQQHAYDPGLGAGLVGFFENEAFDTVGAGASSAKSGVTVVDFGCGRGEYIKNLNKNAKNVTATGIDGNPSTPELTDGAGKVADLATKLDLGEARDWVMSIEVAEHLPPAFEASFLDNIHRHNKAGVVLSWAVPGQGGHGHFNEQPNEYVREKFRKMGYISDKGSEESLRNAAHFAYLKQTLMVFRRA